MPQNHSVSGIEILSDPTRIFVITNMTKTALYSQM